MRRVPYVFQFVAGVMLLAACSADSEPAQGGEGPAGAVEESLAAPAAQAVYDAALDVEVRNARLPGSGQLVTAGQPDEAQFTALREAGAGSFISLRPATEPGAGWEEAYAVDEDVDFARLPVTGAESLTLANVEIFAQLLAEAGEGPVVLYCASSNRVGAMMALKAHWIDGVDPETALQMGLDAGMTRLEGAVRELLGVQ